MRIMYKNIIDNLSSGSIIASSADANYPVTNIQDDRLSTKWIGTGSTDESVIVTLPLFPDIPDSAAGTTYVQDTWADVDGWDGVGYTDLTVASGILRATVKATRKDAYVRKLSVEWGAKTLRLRYRASKSGTVLLRGTVGGVTHTLIASFDVVANTWKILDTYCADTLTVFFITHLDLVAGDYVEIDWIYVGTGAYTTPAVDGSGHGIHGTVNGCTPYYSPRGRCLTFDGVNDYVSLDVTKFTHTGAFVFSVFIEGKTRSAEQYLVSRDTGSAGGRGIRCWLSAANRPSFLISPDNTASVSLVAGAGSECTADCELTFAYKPSTYMRIYKDGALIKETTSNVPALAFYSASQLFRLGTLVGTPFSGFMHSPILYASELSDQDILSLGLGLRFVGENNGLVAKWILDDGYGINSVAVLGHNIKSGTEVKIQASMSDSWADPELDETLTVNPDTILKFLDDTYYYKYWRFYFGQGSVQIGRLWLGDYLSIDPSCLTDFKVEVKNSDTVIHGKNRQKWAVVGEEWRRFELSFPRTEENMIYEISNMFDYVGNFRSILFMNFDEIRDYKLVEPCYVSIDGEIQFNHTHRMGWQYSISLEEEK